jgi:hypothetical protein
MKLVFIIILVLVIGGIFIVKEQKTDFKDVKSTWTFTKAFGGWVRHLGLNIKNIVVCANNLTWKPDVNETNISENEGEDVIIVGGDRDEHGCIPSAGYSWCEELQQCIRPWEVNCSNSQINNSS